MSRTLGLRNRQRVRAIDTRLLRRIARWALEAQFHAADYELGLHLVAAAEMARVNESFLGHHGSTDVITFDHREAVGPQSRLALRRASPCPTAHEAERRTPMRLDAKNFRTSRIGVRRSVSVQGRQPAKNSGIHGEIFLCVNDAVAQARLLGTTWQSELARYLLHGLLHLHGFDDLTPAARRTLKRQENRLLRLAQRRFPLRRLARTRS